MGLKLGFTTKFGANAEYIKIATAQYNFAGKSGIFIAELWTSRAISKAGKSKVALISIPFSDAGEELSAGGFVNRLAYADCAEKSVAQLYAKLKLHKFRVKDEGHIIDLDLTTAENVLE